MKQRVETLQILNALTGRSKGWTRHPATRMWAGHEPALLDYQRAICAEVAKRGFADTTLASATAVVAELDAPDLGMPAWLLDDRAERVAATHRGNLYRKDPVFYQAFAGDADRLLREPLVCHPDCLYYWPPHDEDRWHPGR